MGKARWVATFWLVRAAWVMDYAGHRSIHDPKAQTRLFQIQDQKPSTAMGRTTRAWNCSGLT
ncbi:MAG: hypothetical protein R6V55_08690 [Desulfovermiculus sp.]